MTVQPLKTACAILLVLVWIPVTSHCLLEGAGLFPDAFGCADACSQEGSGSDQDTDSCAAVESADYKSNDEWALVAMPPVVLVVLWMATADDALQPSKRLS